MGKHRDITGIKFGKLTAIKRVDDGISSGKSIQRWLFKCDCGNEKIIRKINVINNGHTSCGCARFYKDRTRPNFNNLFTRYKKGAQARGLAFLITVEEFEFLTKQKCYYCDKIPSNQHSEESEVPYVYNGLDRVNNDKGYIIDNIVPCCKNCNYAKRDFTQEEFLDMIKRIYQKHFT